MRSLTRRAGVALAALLVAVTVALAGVPAHASAAEDSGYGSLCDSFGPLHQYLYATSPDPAWADAVICRESGWNQYARNPNSSAAGLAQFLDSTWYWGEVRFDIWGDPTNGYDAIRMMNAFLAAGEYYHWGCTYESGCLR